MTDMVQITRKGTDLGVNIDRRVYVTGPHFGAGVFSSTDDPADPETLFTPTDATRLLLEGKWRGLDPVVEPVKR